ncbi:MAG: flippase-like domain-containing protein [Candidatus Diapherotrites archaeon]|nr:flippase-like domain-containing protein [Candidatus Diapherotrites archaeon]
MKLYKYLPVIGIILLLAIIYYVGPQKILESLFEANFLLLSLAFMFFFPVTAIQAFKWHMLLKFQGFNLHFFSSCKIFLISSFYACITPGKIGSFIRIPYIHKEAQKPLLDCSINVLMDRLTDIFSLFILAFSVILFLPSISDYYPLHFFALFIAGALGALFYFKKNYLKLLNFLYIHLLPKKFKKNSSESMLGSQLLPVSNRNFFFIITATLIAQLMVFFQGYLIALSFGINLPFLLFTGIVAFSSVVSLIPVSIQGFGTRESVLLYFFSFFSVEPSKTVVFSLISVIVLYTFNIIFGGYLSLKEKI